MKTVFTILLCCISLTVFSESGESKQLRQLNEALQSDFEKADSLIQLFLPNVKSYSENGKLQFALYDILYKSSINNSDTTSFTDFLKGIEVDSVDRAILGNLHAIVFSRNKQEDLFDSQSLNFLNKKANTSDRKALSSVLTGFKEKFGQAEVYFDEALKHAKKARIPIVPSIVFRLISSKYKNAGKYKEAVKYYQKAFDYNRKRGLKLCILKFSLSMAYIQVEMDNIEKAKSFFQRSSMLSSEIKNDWYQSMSLRGLGNVNLITNELQTGIGFFQKALAIYYKIGSDIGVAQTHKDMGKAYFLLGELHLAENNFDLSRTFYNKILSTDNGEDDLYENFALLKYKQKKYSQALDLINKSINKQEDLNGNKFKLYESYGIRSKIYAALGNGDKAYDDLLKSTNYKDSIYSVNLQHQIAELSELYESEEKSKRIYEQEQKLKEVRNERFLREQQLENTQLRNRQIIIVFSFSILLLLAIFFIFYFKNKQGKLKRQQIETELRQQLLRSQMNPHFVFNAMSVIQSYIFDNDTERSSQFLVSLSRLMRLILENSSKESIKLTTELEILERYLFIQKERFENRFEFEIKALSDIDPERINIPPMILQPFIENSTEHGELDKARNGKIRITYKIENQLIIFVVEDNGIGRKAAKAKERLSRSIGHKSMAITITEKRIDLMRLKYGVQGYVKIEDLDKTNNSGTRVTIAIPLIDI